MCNVASFSDGYCTTPLYSADKGHTVFRCRKVFFRFQLSHNLGKFFSLLLRVWLVKFSSHESEKTCTLWIIYHVPSIPRPQLYIISADSSLSCSISCFLFFHSAKDINGAIILSYFYFIVILFLVDTIYLWYIIWYLDLLR